MSIMCLNSPIFPNKTFFEKTSSFSCICLIAAFIEQNFKKIFTADQELQRQIIFGTKLAQEIVLEYIGQYWWICWLIENEMLQAKTWLWQYHWRYPKAFGIEDIGDFNLWNVIAGHLVVTPKGSSQFEVKQTCCWNC